MASIELPKCETNAKLMQMLASRANVGLAKYGVTVSGSPLTRQQWLQHALEEALDLAVYLQRLIDMDKESAT
jgi:sulfur carrier protein ThiS